MHQLNDALPGPYVPVWVTRGAQVEHRYTYCMLHLAAEPRNPAGLLFLSQCPSGMILLTPCSIVWYWLVSRAGSMFFLGLSCSIPTIVFYYFSISLLPVYRLVLCDWGLRTDSLYITLFGLIVCISLKLRPQLIHWSLKYRAVKRPNLEGVSCWSRLVCGITFPTLCLAPER